MRVNHYDQAIADIYDLWYGTDDCDFPLWLFGKLEAEIRRAGVMTDLACGTGTLAIAAAKLGVKVYGLDASCAMLAHARDKARGEKLPVHWIQARMERFHLPEP